jgi:predicted metal-dependent hydrolase
MNTANYEPRYLAGVLYFNQGDFFEAHEVWEDLWHEATGPDRRFYQGLIQVAVGLLHYANGNARGALRLYDSSRDYLQPLRPAYLGLDLERLFQEHEACYAPLRSEPSGQAVELSLDLLPRLELSPAPAEWPDPQAYLPDDQAG